MTPYPRPVVPLTLDELRAELDKARADLAREHDVELHRLAWNNDHAELTHDRPIVEAAEALVAHWARASEAGPAYLMRTAELQGALAEAVRARGSEPK